MNTKKEKTILITGTSRGIGLHLAKRFLKEGYSVVGISRSPTPIKDSRFRLLRANFQRQRDIDKLRASVKKLSLTGLINNVGIHGPTGPFKKNNIHDWIDTFQVNLFSAATLTQMCIPSLQKNKGFIIFLSGGGSGFPRVNFSAYGISKTAVVRFSEVLAKELSPDVMSYCVAPGPNRTRLLTEAIKGGEKVPEGDIVDFDDAERLCLFLARNTDPRYSGKFIHVKDGYDRWGSAQLDGEAYTLRRIKT